MSIILIILICIGTVCLLILFIRYWNAPITKLIESITKQELGILEGTIRDLSEVIILADIVEEPTAELYKSVVSNLKRNVKYTFMISQKNFIAQKDKYYKIFEAIANSNNVNKLVSIVSLSIDWNSYPCILYKLANGDIFAYLGNESKEGIAEGYDFIGPQMAIRLLQLTNCAIEITNEQILSFEESKERIAFTKINLN